MSLYIVKADITEREVDAIVCTANINLHLSGQIGDKILQKAGEKILNELDQLGHCDVGNSKVTKGYNLKAKYVIHTVGPIYQDGKQQEAELLAKAYSSALKLATKLNLETIEFPLISTGTYQYPVREAVAIAIQTIDNYLKTHELNVGLVVYSDKTFETCKDLFSSYTCFDGEGFVDEVDISHDELLRRKRLAEYYLELFENGGQLPIIEMQGDFCSCSKTTSGLVAPADNFNSKLFYYLGQSGKTNPEVYKKAGMDRKLFSKIISNPNYIPKKITVISLIIGMELDFDDAKDLLESAGYLFSDSILFDFIVKNFIQEGVYDTFVINDVLYKNNQPLIC